MTFEELIDHIESLRFAVSLSIMSGFKSMLRVLEMDETIQSLTQITLKHPEIRHKIYERLIGLIGEDADSNYMHEYDSAVTAYLYVLSKTNVLLAQQAIERILGTPNFWWAMRLVKHLNQNMMGTVTDTS